MNLPMAWDDRRMNFLLDGKRITRQATDDERETVKKQGELRCS
jgi:hypothetical protein